MVGIYAHDIAMSFSYIIFLYRIIVSSMFYHQSFSLTVLQHVRTGFDSVDLEYRRAALPKYVNHREYLPYKIYYCTYQVKSRYMGVYAI